jgi:penicillin-binding protein 1C
MGVCIVAITIAVAWWQYPLDTTVLETWPASREVLDVRGRLLCRAVGQDEQWRRPVSLEAMSPWLVMATIATEDERFMSHPGVDPIAICRAVGQNVVAGRIVSGASTLTQQLARMMSPQPRTLSAKLEEALRALQLEARFTKDEILEHYLNVAPYGGNVRGVEAAAWHYFSKSAADLSLGEAATLAGVPQSPARLRPDRYPDRATARRATVLRRMFEVGVIDIATLRRCRDEPLQVRRVVPSPVAGHVGRLALARRPQGGRTFIDLSMQSSLQRLAERWCERMPAKTQVAIVAIDVESAGVVAMIGGLSSAPDSSREINGALAWRSSGSALKPFLYAAAFQDRRLTLDSIVQDVPIERAGWAPHNFDRSFAGEITVTAALQRSLNVPAILVTEALGVTRCIAVLQGAGVRFKNGAAHRSGLSLAVGGADVRLLDVVNAYATVGRQGVYHAVRFFEDEPRVRGTRVLDSQTCEALDHMLSSRQRRPAGFESSPSDSVPWFMWKTGTSSGRRDAWAVGHNRQFAIGVWVGRLQGGGDVAYVGAKVAEPLLAASFSLPYMASSNARETVAPRWEVRNPLPLSPEMKVPLQILAPADGAIFRTVAGQAVVRAHANHAVDVQWFLNGRRQEGNDVERLELAPGSYELVCVGPTGEAAARRFTVRAD